jgi:hypothetical protein
MGIQGLAYADLQKMGLKEEPFLSRYMDMKERLLMPASLENPSKAKSHHGPKVLVESSHVNPLDL